MVASSNVTVTLCTGSSALLASPSIKAPPSNVISRVIVLLLLFTRDCAKILVSRAGTVSRVHVSSQSGGWRMDDSAGPQPKLGEREMERERVGGREGSGRVEGRKDCAHSK